MSLVSAAIQGLFHYYLWRRLVSDTGLPRPARRAATVAIVLLMLSIPATIWAARLGYNAVSDTIGWIAFPWLALLGLTAVGLAAVDLTRVIVALARRLRRSVSDTDRAVSDTVRGDAMDPSRRQFLARATGTAVLATASGAVAAGVREALGEHEVVKLEVPLSRLPPALDGLTIVQITDLHVGLTVNRAFVEDVVARVNSLEPDLIVLTGDLVDGSVADLRPRIAPLADLRARRGVFAVTGNHEYYSGVDAWIAEYERLGMRVLRNRRVAIGDGDALFDLAGIDDYNAGRTPGHGPDLAAALAGRDPSRALVLLAHQPRQVHSTAGHGVDLQLSGHTHGGQIWPWHYIASAQQGGLLAGQYRIGETLLHVSRGVGYWGPPVRVGASAEITRVTLRAGTARQS
jgi:predicted MPP superfamily phosphohydrolase